MTCCEILVGYRMENLYPQFIFRFMLRYFLENRSQLAKFVLVGLVTWGIYNLSFYLFYGLSKFGYKVGVSFAYVITVACHFMLHRIFTFKAGEQHLVHNARKYIVMLALNYLLVLTFMWFVVEIVKVSPYIGSIASPGLTASASFIIMKYYVFGSKGIL